MRYVRKQVCGWVTCARRAASVAALLLPALASIACAGGDNVNSSVGPRALRDVPAARLAFEFEPDVPEDALPQQLKDDGPEEKLEAVLRDFETRRTGEELLRTVGSPDGQRALALYATSETTGQEFRLDLYSADGLFLRNVMPRDLTGDFPDAVSWSPTGEQFLFLGYRNLNVAPTPDPGLESTAPPAEGEGGPAAGRVDPLIAPVPVFDTEQVYVSDRDGQSTRPVTNRNGLIYFDPAWSPDGQFIAARACRENEWNARKDKGERPGGRPRVISLDGTERLLDDRLADAPPAWSPDGSKVATAFGQTVAIYDARGAQPTGANLPVEEQLWSSSVAYDARNVSKGAQANGSGAAPPGDGAAAEAPAEVPPVGSVLLNSFNPVVDLAWVEPETLYVQTAFIRFYPNQPVPIINYVRWHVVRLSAQETPVRSG